MSIQQRHDPAQRGFASDNCSGVHPEVLAALATANDGHVTSYGADPYTARLQEVVRGHFGDRAEAFPVFNGTGANVVALQAVVNRWGAVVCTDHAHVHADEGGAPEKVAGIKLLTVPSPGAKLTPELMLTEARDFGFEHRAQPQVVTLTQTTELGTAYSVDELAALADAAHGLGMAVHVDGARLSNAAATLGVGLRALTTDVGVDVVSLGGTKNGLLLGEAVVVLEPERVPGLVRLRKTSMQLGSKMRFLSAQLEALYGTDLWLRSATHANAMAQRLEQGVRALPGVSVTQPVQANAVFAVLAPAATARLQHEFAFYDWDASTGEVRWMCSFDTTESDVDAFVAAIARETAA